MTRREYKHIAVITAALALVITLAYMTLAGAVKYRYNRVMAEAAETHSVEAVPELEAAEPIEEEVLLLTPDPADVELIGRTIWGEAGGVADKAERAAVAWCILNRVDNRGQTVEQVVTAPHQFYGYRPNGDCPQEHLDLAADVLSRWYAEKAGETNVGRVLPQEYEFFLGDGQRNHFTEEWRDTETWDWSLESPYN